MRKVKTGVYSITCLSNQKIYIGQTINIKRRWGNHRYDLRHGIHKNKQLQDNWNLYGEEMFSFNILEECSKEDLLDKEKYWIDKYNSINALIGFNYELDKPRQKRSENNIPKSIGPNKLKKEVTVSKDGIFVNRYESVVECAKAMNFNKKRIQEVCVGKRYGSKYPRHQYKGYVFRYTDDIIKELIEDPKSNIWFLTRKTK